MSTHAVAPGAEAVPASLLARLVRACLARRALVLLAVLGLVALGIASWRALPVDAFPDVSVPQVKIILKAPGMTPEEVEARVTQAVEQEMLGIPGQTMLRSVAKFALGDITLDFADGTDLYWARNQVAERLARILPELPPDVSGGLAPPTTPLGEVFMFTVENPALTLAERRTLLDWTVRPRLRTVPGVADVNALGGEVRAIEVVPRPADLAARGVSMAALADALRANNRNDGAGRVSEGGESLQVRIEAAARNLAQVRALGVPARDGLVVRIGDVADVRAGALTRYGAVTKDGEEAVQGLVLALRGANARALVDGVRARLAEIEPSLPPGTRLVPFYDRGTLVDRAVSTVSQALLEAVVLVVALLFAFLGNVRAALVVALTLPLAALATFALMRWAGLSANLMSLGGLAVAIGMLVDGAVVVVEHAVARLEGSAARTPAQVLAALGTAVGEVAQPVVTGVGIIALVFVPLLSLEGLEGKLFSPVALTIVFALAASLVLALCVVPTLASLALRAGAPSSSWLMGRLAPWHARALGACFARPGRVALAAVAVLAAAAAALPWLGRSFVPTLDEGDVIVQLEKLPSISLPASVEMDARLQRLLREQVPEVRAVVARTGSDELGLDPMGLNQTDSFVVLAPRSEWRDPDRERLLDRLREVVAQMPGVSLSFTQPIEMRVSEMLTGVRGDVALKVFGPDLATLNRLGQGIADAVRAVPGAQDVLMLRNEGVRMLRVAVDPLAATRLGVSAERLQQALRLEVEGAPAGILVEDGRRTPVLVRGPEALRQQPSAFADHEIVADNGRPVAVSALARVAEADGPVKIDREFGQRYVTVQVNVRDRDLVGFVDDARRAVAALGPLPAGYRVEWGGQFENQQRASARLALVVPVVVALVVFVLWLSFGGLRPALVIVALVPFALAGAVFSLLGFGEYLSVPASVGLIALLGIAVLNGVVMVETFQHLLAAGLPPQEAARQGAATRLRPVLMTASITAAGLVPLLLSTGPGSEVQRPLAVVVVGGLLTATAVTLFVLPLAWAWVVSRRPLRLGRRGPAAGAPLAALALLVAAAGAGLPQPAQAQPGAQAAVPTTAAVVAAATTAMPPLLPPEAAVRAALLADPEVQAAQAARAGERATRDRLVAGEHETVVEATALQRRYRDGAEGDRDRSLAVSRTLRLPGKRALDAELGERTAARGELTLRDARHEAARRLLARWFEAWRQEVGQAQAASAVALARGTLDVVERRLRAGDAATLERLQAEAALHVAQGQALAAAQRTRVAQRRLAQEFPALAEVPRPAAALAAAQPLPPGEDEAGWVEAIAGADHELALARAEWAVQQARAERARANRTPDPTVGLRAFSERGGQERGAGVFVSVPLPGDGRAADERRAVAQREEAAQRVLAAERRVRTQALATHAAAEQGLGTWRQLLQARRNAEASARLTARAFELGEGTLTELLLARRVALDAAALEDGARLDAIEAHARLLVDAHRLWDMDEDE